ncbi:hypothetical protein J31TS4_26460 [Paenibacillus sp. J31TS4]|uniref:hypothetical protein n=1 Tax=Paenibacillus sp. J31TS4 TaxID=2807195 RepID=UPI001B005F90|nr:hypothetical protein [Paenibacillus sp. J31TS4]GIP39366.1 hypothetical protein J31TS4_26460 [Paenibacillus sp. J31TS4]
MKKIGFIDYYLDEWHAEKYPGWIEEATGGEMKVVYAYGKQDKEGGETNAAWCERKGITLLSTIEEVIERSDYLVVLSPDNPEQHEELARLPLQSGKPTYVDKTFAPDRDTAVRLFELAERHKTPLFSTSALRFADEYVQAERNGVRTIASIGPGKFENYSIHQIEPIVMFLGSRPQKVMYTGTAGSAALLIAFEDGRQAALRHFGSGCPFSMALDYEDGSARVLTVQSNFFGAFIREMIAFFETGRPPVDPAETIAIASIIEYGLRAEKTPYEWIALPQG